MNRLGPLALSLAVLGSSSISTSAAQAEVLQADVCIYGATAGGVAAAVQASRMGKKVLLAESGEHVGGMTSGGLGQTDIGNKAAIGGISREASPMQ